MILRKNAVIGLPIGINYKKNVLGVRIRYKNIIAGKPITPKNLTILMYDLYRQKGLVPTLPQNSQYRMAKNLINKVGCVRAVELMFYAANVSKYVWTFKYLIKIADEEE